MAEGVSPRHSRFGINPGPLKVTPPRVKEDRDASRCEATTRDGLHCLRDAVGRFDFTSGESERLCRQHLRQRERIAAGTVVLDG